MNGDPSSLAYRMLSPGFMTVLRERLLTRWSETRANVTKRTEEVIGGLRFA